MPLIALVVALVLLVAAPAGAATTTYGSSLSAHADRAETFPVDTAFWPAAYPSGAAVSVAVKGQANVIRLKGMAVPSSQTLGGGPPPFTLIHFQVLRPVATGWRVIVTSEDFQAPFTGDPDQVSTYTSDYLCVEPGDRLAFANTGGYNAGAGYPDGVPFRVFGSVAGAATNRFTGAGKDNNGDTLTATRTEDEELLMQADIGTGPDARPACGGTKGQPTSGGSGGGSGGSGGGSGGSPTPPVTLPKQAPHLRRGAILSVAAFCHGPGTCRGVLRLTAGGKKIGSKSYAIAKGKTAGVRVKFNALGRKRFKRGHNRLKVTAAATTDGKTSRRTFVVTKR